ncbi:ABC transporter ATP-binding protein [Mesorhizobium sp. L-8-3]|uniref:ABC transporter ATP-binding protein n=1 Tax=Mesorhizobium sp. L-8-3 TaxID=2744522 RepID=UPI001927A83E|nr:ABC transporter ATP-binding protein [Mesorhizobium sp. L-8-3]BCH25414.1 ABC transporter ATP-binding protein [Mesorhizobium sp. L-8-3]
MPMLSMRDIRKAYGTNQILAGLSLDVDEGEFVSLVGPSGCGKSTLLRIIAGLEAQDHGSISIDGKPVDALPPKHREIAMVFQDYALYPHMSVAQNMAMPLIMASLPWHARLPLIERIHPLARRGRPAVEAQINQTARHLGIEHLLDRRPAQLSGGQRQRVALGRALVRSPKLFLMDEPLSNLDAKLRTQVRKEIAELHASSKLTFIYVTHDQIEAMTLSDRVAIMRAGSFVQVAPPVTLYEDPDNVEVARFIGSPEINLLPTEVENGRLRIGDRLLDAVIPKGASGDLLVAFRPEAAQFDGIAGLSHDRSRSTSEALDFDVRSIEDHGADLVVHGALATEPSIELRVRAQKLPGTQMSNARIAGRKALRLDREGLLFFDADGQRVRDRSVSSVAAAASPRGALVP